MPTETTALCTICETNPSLGVGAGNMKKTCVGCIGKLQADNVCPVCRGIDLGNPEHIATCNGKLPKQDKPRERANGKSAEGGTRTATAMGQEAAASKRISQRKAKESAGSSWLEEFGPIYDWSFEEVKERFTKKTVRYQSSSDGKLVEIRVKKVKSFSRDGMLVLLDDLNGDEHTMAAGQVRTIL